MPTATYVHHGDTVNYTPSVLVPAGSVVVVNDLLGITTRDLPANQPGSLAVVGVFDLPKATGAGSALDMGVLAYWDATNQVVTAADASGVNKLLGKTVAASGDDDATIRVRLESVALIDGGR
jgi:predicted RecA/RadA family phage recombinase